jgi:intracellular proteinase inhibitor BsuPI
VRRHLGRFRRGLTRVAVLGAALVVIFGGAATPGRAAAAAGGGTVACVPLERIEPVPVAGDRHYHRAGGATDGSLAFSAGVREEIFLKGTPVDLSLAIRNTGTAPITWSFATAQRFDVILYDDDCREIWRWSHGRVFAQAVGRLTIAPGAIVTYRIRWDQRDQAGRQVRPGAYEARVVFLGRRASHAGPVVLSPIEFAVR